MGKRQFCGVGHRGGYSRFSFDVTDLVRDGENELVVKVEDSTDIRQPRGKQRWIKENFACWYVQTTGIWKTVWMEYVPEIRLDHVKITPVLTDNAVELEYEIAAAAECFGDELSVEAVVSFDGMFVAKGTVFMAAFPRKNRAGSLRFRGECLCLGRKNLVTRGA